MDISETSFNGTSDANSVDVDGRGQFTLNEIISQPVAWQGALDVVESKQDALKNLWGKGKYSEVLVTGCGSTYYLSQAVAPLIQQQLGKRARALPASELLLFPETVLSPGSDPLLLTISRSGSTSETIRATEAYKSQRTGEVLNIGCYGDAELVAQSDLALVVAEGQEQSVVQTRSFSAMLVAAQAAVASLVDVQQLQAMRELPERGKQLITTYHDLARQLGQDKHIERFYFLGSGLQYGLASEANLKMKEMSLSISEAFHFMEFRHGPMSMVNDRTLVVGLVSEKNRAYEMEVLREMRALGARTLVLADQPVEAQAADYQVNFNTHLPEANRGVLYMPVLQILGFYRALKNGQNPDQPHNLTAVIVLDAGK